MWLISRKNSKKGKLKKLTVVYFWFLLLILSITVVFGTFSLKIVFLIIHLLFWSIASAIIFLSKGSGLQGLGSHFILPSAPHLQYRKNSYSIVIPRSRSEVVVNYYFYVKFSRQLQKYEL